MPEYRYIIPPEFDGKSVRTAAVYGLGLSSGLYKQFKFHGEVLLNGAPLGADKRVFAGQELILRIKEKAGSKPEASSQRLKVCYEDEELLIVDKSAPLPSASSSRQSGETLENLVFSYLGEPDAFVYRPVNRLDKGTSGLMAVAKDARMQDRMQRLLHTEDFCREYLAVCEGEPPCEEGIVNAPIGKEDSASIKRIITESGKEALTEYRLLQRGNGRSLLRLRLRTGRTHQIRVHMQSLGCPVCGDFLYGWELQELPGRFALHSAFLRLKHPLNGKIIELESQLPQELLRLLESKEEEA